MTIKRLEVLMDVHRKLRTELDQARAMLEETPAERVRRVLERLRFVTEMGLADCELANRYQPAGEPITPDDVAYVLRLRLDVIRSLAELDALELDEKEGE